MCIRDRLFEFPTRIRFTETLTKEDDRHRTRPGDAGGNGGEIENMGLYCRVFDQYEIDIEIAKHRHSYLNSGAHCSSFSENDQSRKGEPARAGPSPVWPVGHHLQLWHCDRAEQCQAMGACR